MSRITKIWLIIATAFVLVGCVIVGSVMTVLEWDLSKLSTIKYGTSEHMIHEAYRDIAIETTTADIQFVPSENGKASVVCYEPENMKHSVAVEDGTLVIRVVDTRKWHEHIDIHIGTPKVTIYLPQSGYGMLSVKASTGNVELPQVFEFENIDISLSTGAVKCMASASGNIKIRSTTGAIRVENVSAGSLDLSASTGMVKVSKVTCDEDVTVRVTTGKTDLTDIRCRNVISTGDTGDVFLKDVIATEKFSIDRSTGDVEFEGSDAAEIFVETETGDVTGTLLSEKVFMTNTDTGDIDVPKTMTGGRCEITTDTGDIEIDIQ